MAPGTKDSTLKEESMGLVKLGGLTGAATRVSLKMDTEKVRVDILGLMGRCTWVSTKRIRNMEREKLFTQMGESMRALGTMTSSMVWPSISSKQA